MPRVEETLKAMQCNVFLSKAYEVAGQAGGSQHTMSVLQAYQADLLRKLDTGEDLSPKVVKELHKATDLSLRH